MATKGLMKTAKKTTNEQEGKEMSMKNVVLIAGIHGVSGRAAAEHWTSLPGTRVYGLSRRSAPCRRAWKSSARTCSTGTICN
jgi:hypothetical protein